MRIAKFILVLVALCCIGSAPVVIYSSSPTALDFTSFELFWRCEAAAMGAGDCYATAVDDTWTYNDNIRSHTDAVKYGTNGLDINQDGDGNADYAELAPTAGNLDVASFAVGWWMNIVALPAVNNLIYRDHKDSDEGLEVTLQADGDIYVNYDNTGGDSTSCNDTYSSDVWDNPGWAFIQISIDTTVGAGFDYIKVYVNGSLVSDKSDCTVTAFDNSSTHLIKIGDIANDATLDGYFDNYMRSTDPTINFYNDGYADALSCS